MKKKINVTIYKNGTDSKTLLELIGNYNDGKCNFSIRDLEGFFTIRKGIYANVSCNGELIPANEPNTYLISEDGGKTHTMKIEFAEVHELATNDDLANINL